MTRIHSTLFFAALSLLFATGAQAQQLSRSEALRILKANSKKVVGRYDKPTLWFNSWVGLPAQEARPAQLSGEEAFEPASSATVQATVREMYNKGHREDAGRYGSALQGCDSNKDMLDAYGQVLARAHVMLGLVKAGYLSTAIRNVAVSGGWNIGCKDFLFRGITPAVNLTFKPAKAGFRFCGGSDGPICVDPAEAQVGTVLGVSHPMPGYAEVEYEEVWKETPSFKEVKATILQVCKDHTADCTQAFEGGREYLQTAEGVAVRKRSVTMRRWDDGWRLMSS